MAKKFLMADEDLLRISFKYAKYTNKDTDVWKAYIRKLENNGKFDPDTYHELEELTGGQAQQFASGLSIEITNAEKKAKEAAYSGKGSKTNSAEAHNIAVCHSGFPEDGNEAIKSKMYADGLLSWRLD